MATISESWGNCIKELLKRHGLNSRSARLKAGGTPSHTTIMDWSNGVVPKDKELAYHFLAVFPRDEALQCLSAGELPIPYEWIEESSDPLDRCINGLRASRLSEKTLSDIRGYIAQKIAEEESCK